MVVPKAKGMEAKEMKEFDGWIKRKRREVLTTHTATETVTVCFSLITCLK